MGHLPADGLIPVVEELFRWDRTVRVGIYPKLEALPDGAWDQPTGVGRGSLHTILVHVVRAQRN
ncbi:hypothetical protein [Limnochorda pilosa]|uniref:Uncharacterized protein n=1 Tax=Limnochorda pilosa TaxID=1555112 RepID=A0A0K2SGD8_LIMPI|nr:hypothetical protein [Limnochorda pilosa]BAS26163.1 hypothetical protein LIP_0306 [Limnochorda pilosa]